MKVSLKSITPNAEINIVEIARVSSTRQDKTENPEGLINYLIKNKHWSPFQMVDMVMDIYTTRDIGRQILRHRSFEFQEFSQRYADPTEMEFVYREARLQDQKNRQNSIEIEDQKLQRLWEAVQSYVKSEAKGAYKWAIENGIAKEQARVVLPEGMTSTRMFMKGSLRSWIHYCDLRMKAGTQKEHREIATLCWQEVLKEFPSLSELLMGQE